MLIDTYDIEVLLWVEVVMEDDSRGELFGWFFLDY